MLNVHKTLSLIAALVAVACGDGGSNADTDAGEGVDAASSDGGVTSGLRIRLEADPDRGPFDADFDPVLNDIDIVLSDFRAIGDSAPGDDRTRVATLNLTFPEGDSQSVSFPAAPIGQYSRIRARLDRFVIRGTLEIGESSFTWEVDVQPAGGIELDLSIPVIELAAGGDATIELEVELDKPYDEISWDELTPDNGVLRIDETSPGFGEIRDKIIESFSPGS